MSANGTWINQDMKLVRGQRRLLLSGDEISLLNPYKHRKTGGGGGGGGGGGSGVEKGGAGGAGGVESGREEDDSEKEKLVKLEAEAATFTFINLNRWVQASTFVSRSWFCCFAVCFLRRTQTMLEAC